VILFIYGAGGLGREVYDLACRINKKKKKWNEISFIDDIREEESLDGIKIYKFTKALVQNGNSEFIVALGEPNSREKLFNKLKEKNLKLATLIDPTAIISPSSIIEEGVIISPWVIVANKAQISANCLIQTYVNIGHDIKIGKHSVFSSCVCPGGLDNFGEKVYIGMGSIIRDKLNIGDNVIISMGSSVFSDVQSDVIVMGNPARVIRKNEEGRIFK